MSSYNSNQDNNQQDNSNNQEEITSQQVKVVAQTSSMSSSQYPGQNPEQTIQYIPPVYTVSETNEHMQDIIVTEPMVISYQYGKAIRCLTLFDLFFGFLHLLVSPFGLINIIFPFVGYKGASTYNKCFVDTYLGYQILFCLLNIGILLNIMFNDNVELPEGQTTEGIILFQLFNILFNFYFIKITKQLSTSIAKITDDQKILLIHLNFQDTRGIYY